MTHRIRVAADRICSPENLPRDGAANFVYALVSLDRPLCLRYVGVTHQPYQRWRTHTRSGVGTLISRDCYEVGMMLLSGPIADRNIAERIERRTIKAATDAGMCDLNAPRLLLMGKRPARQSAA